MPALAGWQVDSLTNEARMFAGFFTPLYCCLGGVVGVVGVVVSGVPVVPLPVVPLVPEVPLLGGVVPLGGGVVSTGGGVVAGAVLGVVVVSLGAVVPLVPLVPLVVLGVVGVVVVVVVVVESAGGVTVVSVFLQAPSMAASTAAVRMTFDAFGKAFIV
jgi:hypothetical protein